MKHCGLLVLSFWLWGNILLAQHDSIAMKTEEAEFNLLAIKGLHADQQQQHSAHTVHNIFLFSYLIYNIFFGCFFMLGYLLGYLVVAVAVALLY